MPPANSTAALRRNIRTSMPSPDGASRNKTTVAAGTIGVPDSASRAIQSR